MKLELDTGNARFVIRGYTADAIMVNEQEFRCSIVVMPDALVTDWMPQRFGELTAECVRGLAELGAEVIILGTGRQTRFLPQHMLVPLIERSIGFEVMDTRSACRCYAVLASEGRRVAAALLPPHAD